MNIWTAFDPSKERMCLKEIENAFFDRKHEHRMTGKRDQEVLFLHDPHTIAGYKSV